ncbi:MAG: hypothetical protein A3K68_01285 [Euryarchaeota archaeon RBG_16_68_13]|nr:MAG: hypothetical protein A3K68_01285 [Euryarchaeota archaeon RBG_16_68_13]
MSGPGGEAKPASKVSKRVLALVIAVVVVIAGAASAYFLLFSNQAPAAAFSSSVVDNEATFNASASADPDGRVVSYAWDFGDGATATGQTVTHEYLAEGNFTVSLTIEDDDGAGASAGDVVLISLLPVPLFVAETNLLTVDVDATDAYALAGTITSYTWDFGDGNTGTGRLASHTYAAGGTYAIKLTIVDSVAKSRSSEQKVSVDPDSTIYTRIYDICEPTYRKFWEIRRGTYGDKIITNTPPAVEEYPWGFDDPNIGNKDTTLYCLTRMTSKGVNIPTYNMSSPVFFPYMARYDAPPSAFGSYDTTGGTLADLQVEDGTSLTVAPGEVLWLDAFDLGGHGSELVWAATLEVRYSTDAGLVPGNCVVVTSPCIRWSLQGAVNETLALRLTDTQGAATMKTDWIILSAARVSTWARVGALNVSFKNTDPSRSVHIDAVRLVVFYETPAPAATAGQMDLDYRITYATEESQAYLAGLGYPDTSGQDDGFISDLQGTLRMGYETSQLLLGVSGDPEAWWARANTAGMGQPQYRAAAIESAWANWFEFNGNLKYDVYNGFEWFFQIFIFEMNGTVVQQGLTNETVVNFRLVSWGGEVLMARWMYWGSASYLTEPGPDGVWDTAADPTPDDVPSVPRGWYGQEILWWEDGRFTATITDSMDYEMASINGYQFAAGALPGPDDQYGTSDDAPMWNWQAMLMDYVQNSSAHPRGEMKWYLDNIPGGYMHTTPGSYVYGEMYQYDYTPGKWDLKAGETLVIELPRGLMIWFDPVRSGWDPTGEGGKGAPRYVYYFAPLTLNKMEPGDAGLWDAISKTVSMAGPRTFAGLETPEYGLPYFEFVPVL